MLDPTAEHIDGLWREPMNQPAWELKAAFLALGLFTLPLLRAWAGTRG